MILIGEECGCVNGHVVVQRRHHVNEIVEAVLFEHLVHELEHLPHVRRNRLGRQVEHQREGLLVEFFE